MNPPPLLSALFPNIPAVAFSFYYLLVLACALWLLFLMSRTAQGPSSTPHYVSIASPRRDLFGVNLKIDIDGRLVFSCSGASRPASAVLYRFGRATSFSPACFLTWAITIAILGCIQFSSSLQDNQALSQYERDSWYIHSRLRTHIWSRTPAVVDYFRYPRRTRRGGVIGCHARRVTGPPTDADRIMGSVRL